MEKLEYYPGVFRWLGEIVRKMDFEIVMVTNQDGLGTDSFPEHTFHPPQNAMLKAFEGEGIKFNEILIDKTFPNENAPTRKPRTGLLEAKYMTGKYDLANSFVIGDRITDVELAKNLGARAIWINHEDEKGLKEISGRIKDVKDCIAIETTDWKEIYLHLAAGERISKIIRETKETSIEIELNLDGSGTGNIKNRWNTKAVEDDYNFLSEQ